MTDKEYATIARRVARRLSEEIHPQLAETTERALINASTQEGAQHYIDPSVAIALGSLLVSVASLAWTIWQDSKKTDKKPSLQVMARRIRLQVALPPKVSESQRNRIIDVVVEETMKE